MILPTYAKPYLPMDQRLTHLQARGLLIADFDRAVTEAERIGYERLRIYFRSRRQEAEPDRRFLPGTTFEHVVRLYECDRLLRHACFAAVGRFEIALRNAVSETLSSRFGGHPYGCPAAFRNPAAAASAEKLLADVVAKSRDARILHYRATYGAPTLPPIWTLKEVLMFGASSRLLKALEGSIRTAVAARFGIRKDTVLLQWVECLVDLRNICAHHDRLFNRSFQKQPARLLDAGLPCAPSRKLKALLECLDYMLDRHRTPVGIVDAVGAIIADFQEVDPTEVGYAPSST